MNIYVIIFLICAILNIFSCIITIKAYLRTRKVFSIMMAGGSVLMVIYCFVMAFMYIKWCHNRSRQEIKKILAKTGGDKNGFL